jgi:hypothetical protein
MSRCLQIHVLPALPVDTVLLCVHLKQRSQTSSANDSSKETTHCAKKTYSNVDLEVFNIREFNMYVGLGGMWAIGMLNPGQSRSDQNQAGEGWQRPNNSISGAPNKREKHSI